MLLQLLGKTWTQVIKSGLTQAMLSMLTTPNGYMVMTEPFACLDGTVSKIEVGWNDTDGVLCFHHLSSFDFEHSAAYVQCTATYGSRRTQLS